MDHEPEWQLRGCYRTPVDTTVYTVLDGTETNTSGTCIDCELHASARKGLHFKAHGWTGSGHDDGHRIGGGVTVTIRCHNGYSVVSFGQGRHRQAGARSE